MSVGVPIKLLHEATGFTVTCELQNGTIYRGKLHSAEDNMNIQLHEVTCTHRDGRVQQMELVYIRGSQVRFFIVPDMLKHAPMFGMIGKGGVSRGAGVGAARGRAMATRERQQCMSTRERVRRERVYFDELINALC